MAPITFAFRTLGCYAQCVKTVVLDACKDENAASFMVRFLMEAAKILEGATLEVNEQFPAECRELKTLDSSSTDSDKQITTVKPSTLGEGRLA